jgi:PKD repeat protein
LQNVNPTATPNEFVLTTTEKNCSSKDTVLVMVYPIPVAGISPLPGECLNNNSFDFTSLGTFPYSPSYAWSFGVNANVPSSVLQNPSGIIFSSTGYQRITLVVTQNGCVGIPVQDSVLVYEMPQIQFTPNAARGCPPLNVSFLDKSTGGGNCDWNFGDGMMSSQCNTQHTYTVPGAYDVELSVTSSDGCNVKITKPKMITVYPVPEAFCSVDPPKTSIFHPEIHLQSLSKGSTKCAWSFGDHTTSDICNTKQMLQIVQSISSLNLCSMFPILLLPIMMVSMIHLTGSEKDLMSIH